MRVLHYGILQDHALGGDIIFNKGLQQNGCAVDAFDYRRLIKRLGHKACHTQLIERSRQADILFIGKGEKLDPTTLHSIQKSGVHTALWYGDIRIPPAAWLMRLLPFVDTFFMSSGGETLAHHFHQGKPGCAAYFLNPSDPELVAKHTSMSTDDYDVLFTGSAYGFAGDQRLETIKHLQNRQDVTFFGGAQNVNHSNSGLWQKLLREISKLNPNRKVRGEAYIRAIKSAKIGIGLSATHDIDKYTSDRLSHYVSFGTFYLAHDFKGLETLFAENEIVTFHNTDELDKKLNHYLNAPEERQEIAHRAQHKMLTEYNTHKITGMMLEVMKTRKTDAFEWAEVLT